MNKKSFLIRRFVISDVSSVVRLFELVFRHPFPPEWWNWKYKLNPAGFWGEQGDIWVAESEGEIVGYYAVIPEKIKFGSETITVAQSVDTATHPDFRGMGLFPTLAQKVYLECQNRYRFIYGFPSEMAFKGFLRLGWKDFRIVEFVKFLNYDRPLRNFSNNAIIIWSGKASLKTLRILKYLSPSVLLRKHVGSAVEIQKVDQFPDEIDDFWKMGRAENEIVLERTTAFLNWRFSKYFGNYQIYIGRSARDDSIVGYLVLRKTEIEVGYRSRIQNVLDIVDFYALPGEEKLVLNFVDMAIRIAKNEGLDLIHCRIPPWHRYARILSKRGFISLDRLFRWLKTYQPRVIFYSFSKEGIIPKIQQWFYTLADTDYA
jgi:GNAT superfamily N-acetyltransferase